MNTFIGGINGTSKVRPPSRGYKYMREYEKYYRGQLNNVKTPDDIVKYVILVSKAGEKGHIDYEQKMNLIEALNSRGTTMSKRYKNIAPFRFKRER